MELRSSRFPISTWKTAMNSAIAKPVPLNCLCRAIAPHDERAQEGVS